MLISRYFRFVTIGREFSDFLNSLDDLHEYLRLSYPRLKPPSYFCDNENEYGLILHYRTKRNFLLWYTVGQILKVAKLFYSTDVEIELLSENQEINEYHFILQLHFDNRVYLERVQNGYTRESFHSRSISRLSYQSSPPPPPQPPQPSTSSRMMSACSMLNDGGVDSPSSRESSPLPVAGSSNSLQFNQNANYHHHRNLNRNSSPLDSFSCHTFSSLPTTYFSLNDYHSSPSMVDHFGLTPITLEAFMDIFPFSIIFDSNLCVCLTGSFLKVRRRFSNVRKIKFKRCNGSLVSEFKMVCADITGQNLAKLFTLIKPKIDFNWDSVIYIEVLKFLKKKKNYFKILILIDSTSYEHNI